MLEFIKERAREFHKLCGAVCWFGKFSLSGEHLKFGGLESDS